MFCLTATRSPLFVRLLFHHIVEVNVRLAMTTFYRTVSHESVTHQEEDCPDL